MESLMTLIHESDPFCHSPQSVSLEPDLSVRCTACRRTCIPNIHTYITQDFKDDFFKSSTLAQALHAITGIDTPMNFTVCDVEGILPKTVRGQSLLRVRTGIHLLRALNAPFTTCPGTSRSLEMAQFLSAFLNIIHEHQNASNEFMILEALMKTMHDMVSSQETLNPFDAYFQSLVPYVQKCVDRWDPLPTVPEDANLAKELLYQLYRSSSIRKVFGKYSIPFDILHVMVCCFACSSDMDVVGNWGLDFMARIGRGHYFHTAFPHCFFVQAMNHLIRSEISHKKRVDFYHVLRAIRNGESADHLSSFWPKFHELQQFLKDKYKFPTVAPEVTDMAFSQTFPAVLFNQYADQLGFTISYNHVALSMNAKTGQLPKGIFKSAKRIHHMVQRFIQAFLAFDKPEYTWTLDTLNVFLIQHQDLEKEIMEVVQNFILDEKEE